MYAATAPCAPTLLMLAGLAAFAGDARLDHDARGLRSGGEVTVEAVRGLARLGAEDGAKLELAAGEQRLADACGTLELGAQGEASVRWLGRASVRLFGPARIAWSNGSETSRGPEASSAKESARLVCTLDEARAAAFEVREPGVEIEIAGAWTLVADRAAFLVEALPGRAGLVQLQAGEGLRLVRRADPFVEPARRLAAGERAPLLPRARRAPVARESTPPWDEVTWPFGSGPQSEAPLPTEQKETPAAATVALAAPRSASIGEARAPDAVPPRVAPARAETEDPGPAVPSAVVDPAPPADPPARSAANAPEALPPSAPSAPSDMSSTVAGAASASEAAPAQPLPEPQAPPARTEADAARFRAADWRGLGAAQLARVGPLVLERGSLARLVVRSDEQGRLEVSLPAAERESAWCSTERYDFELRPGACAVFDGAGKMVARVGSMKVAAAPATRPSPAASGLEFFPGGPSTAGQGASSEPPRK